MGVVEGIALKGEYRFTVRDARTGRIKRRSHYRNVICVNGKNFLAQFLNGEGVTNPLSTFYGATGTGASPNPQSTDTQLVTELARAIVATNQRTGNQVVLDWFFTTSQSNGNLTEFGAFLNGTSSTNTGQLISHVLISENKTSAETLTVELTITVG